MIDVRPGSRVGLCTYSYLPSDGQALAPDHHCTLIQALPKDRNNSVTCIKIRECLWLLLLIQMSLWKTYIQDVVFVNFTNINDRFLCFMATYQLCIFLFRHTAVHFY